MPTFERRASVRRTEDRERLAAWQRWQLTSIDAAQPTGATRAAVANGFGGVTAGAGDAGGRKAEPEADPAAAELARLREEARTAGYAAGQAQAQMEATRLANVARELSAALAAFEERVADDVLALSLELARQVVRQALAVKPELLLAVIREALAQMPHGHAVIQLHPDDASLVRSYLGDQLAHAGHRIHEDAATARGGCLIEAGGSQLDASPATRWKRLVDSLGASREWLDAGENAA